MLDYGLYNLFGKRLLGSQMNEVIDNKKEDIYKLLKEKSLSSSFDILSMSEQEKKHIMDLETNKVGNNNDQLNPEFFYDIFKNIINTYKNNLNVLQKKILLNEFFEKKLVKQGLFKELYQEGLIDMVLFTGSAASGEDDGKSDLDIFVMVSYENQIKKNIQSPVYEYNYKGRKIEISFVSTDKLYNSKYDKRENYWWQNNHIIYSKNSQLEDTLEEAKKISEEEKRDIIWDNYVKYKLNTHNAERVKQENDVVSLNILLNDNIKFFIQSYFIAKGISKHEKLLGRKLKEADQGLYEKIQNISYNGDYDKSILVLDNEFSKLLLENNFSNSEIIRFDKVNLKRLNFQRK